MCGADGMQGAMFSYVSLEDWIPREHPLRQLRVLVDAILASLSPLFDARYSHTGRPSVAPEKLLRALLLQILFTARNERQLMEQLDYNFLFRWFVDLRTDDPTWDRSVNFKGEKRSNTTHRSTTDGEARLFKKGEFTEARLCFMTHAFSENRHGLIVDVETTQATAPPSGKGVRCRPGGGKMELKENRESR